MKLYEIYMLESTLYQGRRIEIDIIMTDTVPIFIRRYSLNAYINLI